MPATTARRSRLHGGVRPAGPAQDDRLVSDGAPTLVFTHSLRDDMMDHEMASLLARAASFAYGVPNASTLPLREGSCVPYLYYCDTLEGTDPLGAMLRPTTWIDITPQLDRKAEMLACHASQREWLRAYHGLDEYLDSMRRKWPCAAERRQ